MSTWIALVMLITNVEPLLFRDLFSRVMSYAKVRISRWCTTQERPDFSWYYEL